ncbi:MAG: YidC/Oxa1 family membrane protein insertase [Candidatus Vogelbacteria bacterium]|nr:YidC/Oxa1 family membrane protein insertase [Candidatus Vogelbacteria bacterium]
MFSFLFHTIFYQPIYNLLVGLAAVLPTNDVGVAIIIVTVVIRLVTLPLMHKSVKSQRRMKEIEPEIEAIRVKHKGNTQEQGAKIMALYKEHGINPFSGFGALIIQIPIIYALFWVVQGLAIVPAELYSFTPFPPSLNLMFLGFVDVTKSSIVIAILAGVAQFFQAKLSIPKLDKSKVVEAGPASFSGSFQKSMQTQMVYFLPVMITFIGMTLPAAVSIYWVVNSAVGVAHELYVKKKAEKLSVDGKQEVGE